MFRVLAALALLTLSACGGNKAVVENPAVAQAKYISTEGPSITLYTVVNTRTGAGAHSALLVNASESVLFDPAGSFKLAAMPEQGDALYGASPRWMAAYVDYHARETHYVRAQKLNVTAAQAEQILYAVKTNGAVAKAHCANSISRILGRVPGFGQIRTTYFPKVFEKAFAQNPNAVANAIYDATADKSHGVTFIDPKDTQAVAAAGLAP